MRGAEQFYEQIMHRMDLTKETEDEELQEIIRSVIEDAGRREYIPLNERIRISRELFNAFRKLDILQELIEDDEITEIMVNGSSLPRSAVSHHLAGFPRETCVLNGKAFPPSHRRYCPYH